MKILVLISFLAVVFYLSFLFFNAKNSKSNVSYRLLIIPLDGKTKNAEFELKQGLKNSNAVVVVDVGMTNEDKQIFEILKRKNENLYLINENEIEKLATEYLIKIKTV